MVFHFPFEDWIDYCYRIPLVQFRPWEDKSSRLWIAGVVRFPGINNWLTFGSANQMAEIFAPATKLDLNMFWVFPFRELRCHLSTQVNNNFLASHINVNRIRVVALALNPISGQRSGLSEYYWYPLDLVCPKSLVKLCLHTYLLSLFQGSPS